MATSYESCQSIAHELEATQRRANALIDEWQAKQPSRSAKSGGVVERCRHRAARDYARTIQEELIPEDSRAIV